MRPFGHLCEAVLDYLERHPGAKDTVEGIHSYWLPDELRRTRRVLLQAALDELVARGWLVASRTGTSGRLYGIKPQGSDTGLN